MYFYKAFKPSPVAEKGGVPLSGAGNFLLAQKVAKDAPKGTPLWYPRRQNASACSPARRSVTIHAASFSAVAPAVQSTTARHQRRCASVGANFFLWCKRTDCKFVPAEARLAGCKKENQERHKRQRRGCRKRCKAVAPNRIAAQFPQKHGGAKYSLLSSDRGTPHLTEKDIRLCLMSSAC